MLINQIRIMEGTTETPLQLYQGARWNKTKKAIEPTHHDKDIICLELVHNSDEEGYLAIHRAPATAGTPSFTELLRVDHNGNIQIGLTGTFRLGSDANGSWQIKIVGGKFEIQEKVAGVWTWRLRLP